MGSVEELPFENGRFDYVVGNSILQHLGRDALMRALGEAHRVLKPRGTDLFTEPVENSKCSDLLQNLFPLGEPGTPQYRPSILQRRRWRQYLERLDNRALSNEELLRAGRQFRVVRFRHFGLLIRLARWIKSPSVRAALQKADRVLTADLSPLRKLSQMVLVRYSK